MAKDTAKAKTTKVETVKVKSVNDAAYLIYDTGEDAQGKPNPRPNVTSKPVEVPYTNLVRKLLGTNCIELVN